MFNIKINIVMKKSILLSCIIAMAMNVMAYHPIVVDGYNWNVVNRRIPLNNTIEYYTSTEKIEGDSVVNGITYKKLWRSTNKEMTEYNVIAIIREDIENQKVWAYIGDKEYLIYDFACQVGDKVTVLKSLQSAEITAEEVELTINAIEEFEDFNGVKLNKYIATVGNIETVYYERYGSENGWYSRSYDDIVGGGINFMICAFDANDELQFKPIYNNELDEISDCYINETKSDIADINTLTQNIYYNSQEKVLFVDIENAETLMVYDAMGKIVMTKEINSTTKRIPANLNTGIYIITTKDQNVYSKIVVK